MTVSCRYAKPSRAGKLIWIAGVAGPWLVRVDGEYAPVSPQADTEQADLRPRTA
ncbi:hypothetical protein [Shinella zoogloeoides]|uniref:hypothetical protein n=1 Tax=Shinella zoogloeoides TaxID=352475 RepID=UPI00299DB631|nr:hypothetical protein [Shinella zoogloeoides]WPE24138.1 hypothetical protein ShzoTeo12_53580 [Shinella zoogloeoides]